VNETREIGMALATLAEAYGLRDLTPARIKIYERALKKIPVALLSPMVEHCIDTRKPYGRDWLPSVEELRADAEWARQDILKRTPYEMCAQCEDSQGWLEIEQDGVKRLRRCSCRAAYLAKLDGLGAIGETLSLPPVQEFRQLTAGEMD